MRMVVNAVEIHIPGGGCKYQCTRCWGVYNTREQAETISENDIRNARFHRCRAHPMSNGKREKHE